MSADQGMKEGKMRIGGLLAFLIPFVYLGLLTLQGFDLSEEGNHLTYHMLYWQATDDYPFGMLWLTHFLGSLWQRGLDRFGLLGARFGWVTTLSLTSFLSYRVLAAYFPRALCLLATIATSVVLTHHGVMVINQNNVPFLILLLAAALLLAGDRRRDGRGRWLCSLGGGALLGIALMARLPLAPSLLLPLVPALVRWAQRRRIEGGDWFHSGVAIAAAMAAIGVCLGWLYASHHLHTYWTTLVRPDLNGKHTTGDLLSIYGHDSVRMAQLTVTLLGQVVPWAIGFHVLCRGTKIGRFSPLLLGVLMVGWVVMSIRSFGVTSVQWEYFLILPGLHLLAAGVIYGVGLTQGPDSETIAGRQVLLVIAVVISALIMLGSDNGLLNMMHGMWLFIPVVWFLMPESLAALLRRFGRASVAPISVGRYVVAVAASLVVISGGIRFVNPFRDSRARWKLRTEIGGHRLEHVFTTQARAVSMRELFAELGKRVKPGDHVLAYGEIPMIHYVTQTLPALVHPWPEILRVESINRRLAEIEAMRRLPVAVVKRSAATLRPRGERAGPGTKREKGEILDAAVGGWCYYPVWSNAEFCILQPVSPQVGMAAPTQ